MTVSSTTNEVSYTGPEPAALPFTFRIFQDADLLVTQIALDGTITTLALTTDYTVQGVLSYTGGTVTLTAGDLATGVQVIIARAPADVQDTSLQSQGAYDAKTIENALDLRTMVCQWLQNQAGRSLKIPQTESGSIAATTIPGIAGRAGRLLAFDSSGNPIASSGDVTVVESVVQVVDTIAALKALPAPTSPVTVYVRGYYTAGDYGSGTFRWNYTDVTADNGGTVIAPNVGTGRWNRIYTGPVSLFWFGAVGNLVTDDTAAVQAAVTYCVGNGQALLVPIGQFLCTSAITGSGTRPVSIIGLGVEDSVLMFNCASGGLSITLADWPANGPCYVGHVGILTKFVGDAGTPLTITYTTVSGSGTWQGACVEYVTINRARSAAATCYWSNGMAFTNCGQVDVQNCSVIGHTNTPAGKGLAFLGNCTSPRVQKCRVLWWDRGYSIEGTTEGGDLIGCVAVACTTGAAWDTATSQPGGNAIGCHFNSFSYGIYGHNRTQLIVSGCLFYRRTEATGAYWDVYGDAACDYLQVSNCNILVAGTSGTEKGIESVDGAGVTIAHNCIRNRAVGWVLGSTCNSATVYGNNTDGLTTHGTNGIVDPASYREVDRRALGGAYAILKAAGQTLTTGVAANVTWTAAGELTNGGATFAGGSPTRLTIPPWATRAVVKANVKFDASATGYRMVRLLKNGATFLGMGKLTQQGLANPNNVLEVASALLVVASGDYFEVEATQTSGGNLDLLAGDDMWFAVELYA